MQGHSGQHHVGRVAVALPYRGRTVLAELRGGSHEDAAQPSGASSSRSIGHTKVKFIPPLSLLAVRGLRMESGAGAAWRNDDRDSICTRLLVARGGAAAGSGRDAE